MTRQLLVKVLDVNQNPVNGVTVRVPSAQTTEAVTQQSAAAFEIPDNVLSFDVIVPETPAQAGATSFWEFSATFSLQVSGGTTTFSKTSGRGMADCQNAGGFQKLIVIAYLSMLKDATGLVKQPPQDGKFVPQGVTDLAIPGSPIVNTDTKSAGSNRLNSTFRSIQSLIPQGKVYIAQYKTTKAPQLVMCWKPDYFQIAQPIPGGGGVGYHLWFHPLINRNPAISWGDYPFGYETTKDVAPADRNQGYVNLGYKHLIWENWPLYQHFQARKKVIFVVPVGSMQDQFTDIQSRAGVFRLIKELNLFLHNMENATYSTWNANEVGRVALSSLSYGGTFLQNAIETPGSSALAPSNEFYDSKLREVYAFDITISSGSFISTIKSWWRQDPDRRFRIYTQDPAYVNFSEDTFKTASGTQKIFNKVAHLQFPEVNVTEAHFDNLRSLVELPDPFFSSAKGYPTGSDPHHWFPRYFMSHALSNSGFPV